jgi:hypothetical protein
VPGENWSGIVMGFVQTARDLNGFISTDPKSYHPTHYHLHTASRHLSSELGARLPPARLICSAQGNRDQLIDFDRRRCPNRFRLLI